MISKHHTWRNRSLPFPDCLKCAIALVYRPIKGGIQKAGSNGQTLILAEYIGTHRKGANEKRMGGFQDMQYGSMGQNFVKTDLAGKEMWVEPFLDGTLRWVPYILKD